MTTEMKTHIGNDRCTRCGGGSLACPVCSPVEELPKGHKYCRFCDRIAYFYDSSP